MATLNGAEFKIIEIEWSTYQNNVIQEILGSDTVEVQNQGHGSEPVRIRGMVNNEKEMDDFQEQFYSSGVLTLIKDPNSNRQYSVYALESVKRESVSNSLSGTGIVFTCMMQLRYPYSESVDTITRSKSVTTQNQEWSADDDSIDIRMEGNVDSVPDIQVTGGAAAATLNRTYGFGTDDTDATEYDDNSESYVLKQTYTYTAKPGIAYNLTTTGLDHRISQITQHCYCKVTYQAASLNGGAETDIIEWDTTLTGYTIRTTDPDIQAALNENLVIKFYIKVNDNDYDGYMKNLVSTISDMRVDVCKNPQVYNIADTTVKSDIANEVLVDAVHRINKDGTGSIVYSDDFSTTKYLDAYYDMTGVTHDAGNDELDIADDGYIYWECDTKYPINGIPTLTSRINITTGIPTIQISSDGITWYDIDTAIIDDVETEYPLASDGNLSLPGKTLFYFRFDCVKAAAATCSIKNFELDVVTHTVYAKNPKIIKGSSPSTFRIDQDSDSSMVCTIDLISKNRWWV